MSQEYFQAVPVFEIPEDSTAAIIRMTITSQGAIDDLSAAGGPVSFNAQDEDGVSVVKDGLGAFTTTGVDGDVEFAVADATQLVINGPRDLLCEFVIGGFGGGTLVSRLFILRVTKRARVA